MAPLAYTAPLVAAPAVVASSSQVIARNYNGLAAPIVAAAPYTAAYTAPFAAAYTAPLAAAYTAPFAPAHYAAYPYASSAYTLPYASAYSAPLVVA